MGSLYRRSVKYCTTCQLRRVRTADWRACADAGHPIVIRERPIWWIKYHDAGRLHCVSSHSTKKAVAHRLLAARTSASPPVVPAVPPIEDLTFEAAAADLCEEYRMNGRRSLRTVELRIAKHLRAAFGGRGLSTIRTGDIRAFTAQRQAAGAASGSINRDLVILKRMFTLAIQSEALRTRPYIPLLKEHNVRRGFFEHDQFLRVHHHLPAHMRGIVAFAFITGWRTPSEVLPLEWRQVDMTIGEVRLDAGTTKNGDARVFPFTTELRRILDDQQKVADALKQAGIPARCVFCYTSEKKAGKGITESGFHKAWRKARVAAGCPGHIPHDFRRTAVRNLVRAGVPERVAMQLTGHKTRAVFERYNIVSPGDLRDAAQRLNTYAATEPRTPYVQDENASSSPGR